MKNVQQTSLLETGVLSIVVGIMAGLWNAHWMLYAVLLICVGIAVIVYSFRSKSEFDRLWKNLDLVRDNQYPKLESRRTEKECTCYRFWAPVGIGLDDFEKNKSAIVQYFGRDITIKREGKLVCIEVDNS